MEPWTLAQKSHLWMEWALKAKEAEDRADAEAERRQQSRQQRGR